MSLPKRQRGEGNVVRTEEQRMRAGEVYVAAVNEHFAMLSQPEASAPSTAKASPEESTRANSASPPAKKQRAHKEEAAASTSSPRQRPKPEPSTEAPLPTKGREGRTVEQTYQKKTQLEHILLRPDSYVGSVEKQAQDHWVLEEASGKMVRQKLDYVPALYKIFDEILVNAADNLVRSPNQDTIKVDVDAENGWVRVWNNGAGLPVVIHKEHKCYVPELVFGQLLTSDNYDDDERKVTGGRNGYGAKLTNIFSHKFILETADSDSGKQYKQTWESNMSKRNEPEISDHSGDDFTCITFYPDFAKFGMTAFEKDIVTLMQRRAYDVAASTHGKCKVFLNGKELSVKSFEDFVSLHLDENAFKVCQVVNDRWEVAVALVPDGSGFQQVSFVNSISTCRGGTHVNMIADQLINPIMEKMGKIKNGLAVKPQHVRGYLMVFVNCLIENPCFDSQTKETLTSKKERFGSTCPLPEALINTVLESGILTALQEWSKALGQSELAQYLNRSDMGLQKRLFGIPKLEDANKAGTKDGGECTLILTEGDSAKALAVAGLGVIGRDLYGVFPLRGKLRNVRDLTVKQMLENREIDQLMKIMALDASKSYDSNRGLRYGSIMIMTDQDHDGSHIKGLIINFLHYWFPSLLRIPGFLKEFVTPIVKLTKGDETQTFFTLPEYEAWKKDNNDGHGWKSKYYKGLGTSTSTEGREYFASLEDHEIIFTHEGAEDDDLIDMSFNHARADDRKTWISRCQPETHVDHTQATISYNEFVNKELVLFAKYDVERMIPSVVDGLKPGQRKVLFGCFKKKVSSDIKVAQLSGYVAEHSSYHHGETSLQGTIIGLAQNFVGSNNINLLVPSGQFGTRLAGGKDHAASRYIFTRLSKATRCLFPEEDDAVLEYLHDEGMQIEPSYYAPIIPLVAANGADGIGVGWSCTVPNYNPRELISNVRRFLRKEEMQKLLPWYRGFKGTITEVENMPGKYECCGVSTKRGRTRLEVTELPVRKWTQDYKEWLLEQLPKNGDERRALITEVREYHTENSVHFVLSLTPDKLADSERKGLQKTFHLKSSVSTTNMWLFDPSGKIKKYETIEDIIKDFAKVRLEIYAKRKAFLLEKMMKQLDYIDNKLRFVQLVVTDTLEVDGRKSQQLCNDMRKHGLKHKRDIDKSADGAETLSLTEEMGALGYKYLLNMKLWTLTEDRLQELKKQHQVKAFEIEQLEGTSLEELWERDLVKLDAALDQIDREDAKEAEAAARLAKKTMGDDMEDLSNNQCVLVLTQDFRAKRVKASEWKAQRRGKKLQKGALEMKATKAMQEAAENEDSEAEAECEKEALRDVFCCHDFDALLVFTEEGNVFSMQALDVPAAKTAKSKATPIKEFLPEIGTEHICSIVSIAQKRLKDQDDEFLVLVSAQGLAKKVQVSRFRTLERLPGKGTMCFKLGQGDKLRCALRATENSTLLMATENGYVLRTSLGSDWNPSGAKGPGRKAIKCAANTGDLAACCVTEMTQAEIEILAKAKEAAREKLLAKQKAAEEAGEATNAAAPGEAGAAAKPKGCDDDDSDNGDGGEDAAAEDAAADEDGQDAQEEDEDGADSDAERPEAKDGEAGDKAAEDSPALEATSSPEAKRDWGTCLLMVTENGLGMRVPFTHKRLQLMKRGRRGQRVIKVGDSDDLMGACIVTGKVEIKKPADPRSTFKIWYADKLGAIAEEFSTCSEEKRAEINEQAKKAQEEELAKQKAAEAEKMEVDAPKEEKTEEKQEDKTEEKADEKPEEKAVFVDVLRFFAQQRFRELSESDVQELEKRAREEEEQHEKLMEEYSNYKPDEGDEVMVASKQGFLSRIMVDSVPVMDKKTCVKGIRVIKLKGRDTLSSLSKLSDDTAEEAEAEQPQANPAAASDETPAEDAEMEDNESPVGEEQEQDAAEAEPKEALSPTKVGIRRPDLALPSTPPTNRKASKSQGLAAASLLDSPTADPRKKNGKRPATEVANLSVDDRSVARPTVARRSVSNK